MLAPKLSEEFVDILIEKAGGRRLTDSEKNYENTENADYLIGDSVVELKEIREEALEKNERQQKIAKIFSTYFPTAEFVELDASVLSKEDRHQYLDIIGRPIQNQIKKAAKQIKRTKEHLRQDNLHGVVIMMNTGYATLPPEVFEELCNRYAQKDTTQIKEVFCISSWFLSNGFDSEVFFQFSPSEEGLSSLGQKLYTAYSEQLDGFMSDWARSGFMSDGDSHSPMEPIAFEVNGQIFSWLPPKLPKSWQ